MEIQNDNGIYSVEFVVTDNFNLHLERVSPDIFEMFQKTVESGEYAPIFDDSKFKNHTVIDTDFVGYIFPKYIKIISFSEITNLVITDA